MLVRLNESLSLIKETESLSYLEKLPIFVVCVGLDYLVQDWRKNPSFSEYNAQLEGIYTPKQYLYYIHGAIVNAASNKSRIEVLFVNAADVEQCTKIVKRMFNKFAFHIKMEPYNTSLIYPMYAELLLAEYNWKRCKHAFTDMVFWFKK